MSDQTSDGRRPAGFGVGVLDVQETDQRLDQRSEEQLEGGDHERFSHYVPKDKLMEAMVNGTPVVALCGKVWVPNRDPQKFPVCPDCKEIWEQMQDDGAGGPEGGSE